MKQKIRNTGVQLALQACEHSANDIKFQSAKAASETHTYALPTYLRSCTLGPSNTFRAPYITHKFDLNMSAMEPAVDKLEALVIITSLLWPFSIRLCIKSTCNVLFYILLFPWYFVLNSLLVLKRFYPARFVTVFGAKYENMKAIYPLYDKFILKN